MVTNAGEEGNEGGRGGSATKAAERGGEILRCRRAGSYVPGCVAIRTCPKKWSWRGPPKFGNVGVRSTLETAKCYSKKRNSACVRSALAGESE